MKKLMINYMIINVQPSKREARSKLFPINIFINVSIFVYINVRKAKNTAPPSPLPPAR